MNEIMILFHNKFDFEEDFDSDIAVTVTLGESYSNRGSFYQLPQDLFFQVRNWAILANWSNTIDPRVSYFNVSTLHKPMFEKMLKDPNASN